MPGPSLFSRRGLSIALLGLVFGFGGSTSIGVADDEGGACAPNICGRWSCGSWHSHCTSHHGKLRATICRGCNGNYECTFSGTFFGMIPFRYTTTLYVTGYGDGVVYFRASRNLPLFGGSFTMCGQATACKFTANYSSGKDRGVFTMSR
jgi:hypothetical protein